VIKCENTTLFFKGRSETRLKKTLGKRDIITAIVAVACCRQPQKHCSQLVVRENLL